MKSLYLMVLMGICSNTLAADNIITPSASGEMYLQDANGIIFPAQISYTTDGAGHLHLINSANPVDDDLVIPPGSGKAYLLAADGHTYPVVINYTTDGNGHVIPISSSASGVASVSGTAPIQSSGGTDPIISCLTATDSIAGCLSAADHATFSGKQASLSSTTPVSHQYITGFTAPNTFTQASISSTDVTNGLGYIPEDVANKSTSVVTDQASNTKYASVKAIYDWVMSVFELLANKVTNFNSPNNTTYPSTLAAKTYADTEIGGIPTGVYTTSANRFDFMISKDGLLMQSYNTAAFAGGAFNGAGTGAKGLVEFDNYHNLAFSALTDLSFTARNIRDENSTNPGKLYWNLLANFSSGALTTANDYANIVIDGLSQHLTTPLQYFKLTGSHVSYDLSSSVLASDRMVKAVGGTEGVSNVVDGAGAAVASITCTYTSGSAVVTGCSNTASFTVGQYVAADIVNTEYSLSNKVAPGARIQSIDSSTQYTLTTPAVASGTVAAFFYGGIAPVSRVVTCNGSTTITGVTNTDDLQANMIVNGTGSANSFIVSKVRNTSITLNNSCSAGTPTISFIPAGKTGMPGNGVNIGVTWATVVANNPNGKFVNVAPTVAGGWTAFDGGYPKNSVHSAFSLVMGSSSTLDSRINSLKSVTINSDTYTFAK